MPQSRPTIASRLDAGAASTTLVVAAYVVVVVGLLSLDLLSTAVAAALGDGRLPFHVDCDAMDIAGLAARTTLLAATAILGIALRRSGDRRVVAALCTAWGLFVSP